jgi:hypothetical protein
MTKTTEELAREAGFTCPDYAHPSFNFTKDGLARFEALVRADERERCAKVCEGLDVCYGDWLVQGELLAAEAIRELK